MSAVCRRSKTAGSPFRDLPQHLQPGLLVKPLSQRAGEPRGSLKSDFFDSLTRGKFTLSSVEPTCKH